MALIKGVIHAEKSCLVRVHTADVLSDLLGVVSKKQNSWGLSDALEQIHQEDSGILLLLGKHQTEQDILDRLLGEESNHRVDYRHVGVGSQILKALGVKKMRLLTNANRFYALSGFGLEVTEIVSAKL